MIESSGERSGGASGTVSASCARLAAWVSPSETMAKTWPPRPRQRDGVLAAAPEEEDVAGAGAPAREREDGRLLPDHLLHPRGDAVERLDVAPDVVRRQDAALPSQLHAEEEEGGELRGEGLGRR